MTAIQPEQSISQLIAEAATTYDGLRLLEAMRDGEIPSSGIGKLLGMRILDLERGAVRGALDPAEKHYSPLGMVHGGVVATMLDTAMCCALQTLLPAGVGYTTSNIDVRFIRPITVDTGTVFATGTVLHHGRRTATAEGKVVAARDGKLLAHGTSTLLVLS